SGGFMPRGFTMDSDDEKVAKFMSWAPLFHPYMADRFEPGGGGADIGPLKNQGVPLVGFRPDGQRYFDYHHTHEDTFDKVDDRELHMGAAAIASLLYLIDQHGL
ncbi:MAG: peptidase M28 family protein, partial [Bacteroidota bacterium]